MAGKTGKKKSKGCLDRKLSGGGKHLNGGKKTDGDRLPRTKTHGGRISRSQTCGDWLKAKLPETREKPSWADEEIVSGTTLGCGVNVLLVKMERIQIRHAEITSLRVRGRGKPILFVGEKETAVSPSIGGSGQWASEHNLVDSNVSSAKTKKGENQTTQVAAARE